MKRNSLLLSLLLCTVCSLQVFSQFSELEYAYYEVQEKGKGKPVVNVLVYTRIDDKGIAYIRNETAGGSVSSFSCQVPDSLLSAIGKVFNGQQPLSSYIAPVNDGDETYADAYHFIRYTARRKDDQLCFTEGLMNPAFGEAFSGLKKVIYELPKRPLKASVEGNKKLAGVIAGLHAKSRLVGIIAMPETEL